jgi:protein SCO1/2
MHNPIGASILLAVLMMHGVVLAIDPKTGTAVVKHDPFGGMPAMTMTFAVSPGDAARLKIGDEIRSAVETTHEPWKLHVASLTTPAAQPDTGAQPPITLLAPGDPVPDAAFVDQLGRQRSWTGFRGHTTVVAFIYTRCKDALMCPLVSAKFEQLQRTLPPHARLIEFTLDPAYDVPSVLKRYGAMFGADPARWTLATGDAEVLRKIAAEFGIGVSAQQGATLVHSEVLGIVDRFGNVQSVTAGNTWQPDEVEAAVRDAEGLASNPWHRFVLGLRYAARRCGLGNASFAHSNEILVFLAAMFSLAGLTALVDLTLRWKRRKAGEHSK